jgi:putative transposase
MKTIKTYKFRLNPDESTLSTLKQHGGNSRFIWNKLVNFSSLYNTENKKFPSQIILQKEIIRIKNENEFLKLSHSQPLQINAQRLNTTNFKSISKETIEKRKQKIAKAKTAKQIAKALNFGKPKFKSKHNNSDSIFYPQNFKVKKSRIFVAKIGWISFIKHQPIEGKPLTVIINQDGEQWFVSICCEIDIKLKEKVDLDKANIVGVDLGTKTFATLSDNTKIENPRTLKKHLKKLKREQRVLSKRKFTEKEINGKTIKVSSNNRTKQRIKVQKIHRKVRNIRTDFLHNTTHHLITKYDGFALETLDIKKLMEEGSKKMNRNISDVSWYDFCRLLEYKSIWNAKHFVKVDQYFPSTKKCSQCGNLMSMELKDRTYNCNKCGNCMDRDYNASLNILNEGLRILKGNTLATKEMHACGQSTKVDWLKQEKLESVPVAA